MPSKKAAGLSPEVEKRIVEMRKHDANPSSAGLDGMCVGCSCWQDNSIRGQRAEPRCQQANAGNSERFAETLRGAGSGPRLFNHGRIDDRYPRCCTAVVAVRFVRSSPVI